MTLADNIRYSKNKKVAIYDDDDNLVREFESLKKGAAHFGSEHSASISKACKDPSKKVHGYYWRYV